MRYSDRELFMFALMWFTFGVLACWLFLHLVFHI